MNEPTRILNFLASAGPYANTTATGEDLDQVMMRTGGSIIACGILYNIKSKRLSPKVWKLTLERAN